jgi:hypothetical protein
MRLLPPCLTLCFAASAVAAAPPPETETITVFDRTEIHWVDGEPDLAEPDGYVIRHLGQTVQRDLDLPAAPDNQRDARRIVATITVEPIYQVVDGRRVPNDPWTRLGSVSVLGPDLRDEMVEIELIRFVTPYGGPATYEVDVTALAPLLHGRQTIRGFISTYGAKPSWTLSLSLTYTAEGVGQRRPVFARHLFLHAHVSAEQPWLRALIDIPENLDQPRLRLLTTGHATDGLAQHEFSSCPHVLRIDGQEVARWRPWSEAGGPLRDRNPMAGRSVVGGREIRSSDFDRTGWHPGMEVTPLVIPLPELTPGEHRVELQILDIRPQGPPAPDGKRHHGYWAVSAIVIADEPWPEPNPDDPSSDRQP